MQFAVVKTGGKQYVVAPGQKVRIEKIAGAAGETVIFDDVLLTGDENGANVGAPRIAGAQVKAEILRQGREDKKIVFRYKSKTRQRVKRGHRQYFTEVKILSVSV